MSISISNVNTDNNTGNAKETRTANSKNITAHSATFNYLPPLINATPFPPQPPLDPHANLVIIQTNELAENSNCANDADQSKLPVKTEDIVDDTDPSVNLHNFFLEQLRESKDRMYLLRLEDQFISLIQDSPHSLHYQHITSYHRMLIHRMATYFGLDHTLDDDGTGVNVTKTAKSRIPETRFCDLIPAPQEGEQGDKEPVIILRRKDPTEQPIQPNPQIIRPISPPSSDSETKSIKEREETYAMVRARIFEGEASEGELVPTPILIPSEDNTPESDFDPLTQPSKIADPPPLIDAPVVTPAPPQVPTPVIKEESEVVPGSNNNKSHSGNSNSRRRNHDNNNRHVRNKNSFQNQASHHVPYSPQLVLPSSLPYLQIGSFYNHPQSDPNLPLYPFSRHPLSSHNNLPANFPIPPNLSLLPTQPSIPISNQHFLPQSQHNMRSESPPFIPNPHLPAPPPLPQSAMQVPTPTINPSFAQYQANLSMMNMGVQTANPPLLQRGTNPSFQPIPPVSDVMNFLPQVPPTYEPSKEDSYVLMPGYQQMGSSPYPAMQWEQSGPGVLKLKHQPSALSPQMQMSQSIQQIAANLEMMNIQPGEDMYLHPNHKHLPPSGEMYPNYSPYPNHQMNPNATLPGQNMYVPNNFAIFPYQYQNQEGAIHPTINPSMSNSRFMIAHPTSVANSPIPIPESGFQHMMTPRPIHNMVPNVNSPHSHTNGQQHPFVPLNQMNTQMLQVQPQILPNPHLVNNQDFPVNNQNFKNLKHSKSTDPSFNQENNRSKSNRHSNSRNSSEKSRHRSQQPQNSHSEQQKTSGSIYIPPRGGTDSRPQGGEKDGLLPTPASMRILEIFDLKISFEEAEICIREISPVDVTFHCLKPSYSNQEVLLGIFDSDEVTDILNRINSNPTMEFKTRFPDQTLVKYLSSTILQQTASN